MHLLTRNSIKMKTFVISLKKSVERRERIQQALIKAGIEFTFFDAIEATTNQFKYSNKIASHKTTRRFGYTLTRGEIACYASHHLMWEKCIELNEPILVLEDNGAFSEQLQHCFPLFDQLISKYDFIKLGGTHQTSSKPARIEIIERINSNINLIRYCKRDSGARGYLITPKAAKQFIKNATEFIEPVDDYMEKPWRHSIKSYCFSPNLVMRATIPSVIGSNRKNKDEMRLSHKIFKEFYKAYEKIRYKLYK